VATELFDELEEFLDETLFSAEYFSMLWVESLWNVPPLTSRAHKHLHGAIHQVPDIDFAATAAATIRSDEGRDLNPFRIGQVLDRMSPPLR
jgi:hypothetical protein